MGKNKKRVMAGIEEPKVVSSDSST